jgi:hypothetical protein
MSSSQQLLLAEGAGGVVANYIEEVFSTYLYTGNGSTQTITNGIDLSTKGGLVWLKIRSSANYHALFDTNRGATTFLKSNTTEANETRATSLTSFNTNGFSLSTWGDTNGSGSTFASWTFRKQPKFFDIVTYTGDGTGGSRQVAHNLGSTPGCVLIKRTDASGNWMGFHRNTGATNSAIAELSLNLTTAPVSGAAFSQSLVTSTYFVAGDIQSADGGVSANANGATYVAYLFAHNAGGFGLAGTDNVISCGSFTGSGAAGQEITLGYEPQWLLVKNTSASSNWFLLDNMRDWTRNTGNNCRMIRANTDAAEEVFSIASPTATGFITSNGGIFASGNRFIYIAIRRGPMKVPTTGTSVFVPYAYTGNGSASRDYSAIGIVTDTNWTSCRSNDVGVSPLASTRLLGNTTRIQISSSGAEATGTYGLTWSAYQNGVQGNAVFGGGDGWNTSSYTYVGWNFRRAPSFFDVVCYTGNGTSGATQTHNLAATPELMIARQRTGGDWYVYTSGTGATKFLVLNATDAAVTDSSLWNNTAPTSSVFTLGNATGVNRSATNFIAYLFATCAGVSKVGSYTGTGATQTISCGFTGGARFVLIKRTDTASYSWFVWDTARGMVSGTDPRLPLNNTDAESNADWVFTTTGGFQLVTSNASVNASGGSYIFLAIA